MTKVILTLNAGSSSLKWSVYTQRLRCLDQGVIERIGLSHALYANTQSGQTTTTQLPAIATHQLAVWFVAHEIKKTWPELEVTSVGHRFVHGGSHSRPMRLFKHTLKRIAQLDSLAPLHNPLSRQTALAAIRFWPRARQVAAFDTAFFAHLPWVAKTYALPVALAKKLNLHRYGFHGLSHPLTMASAAKQIQKPTNAMNAIILHLGSGSSITAIHNGQPVDTSMGMTPLEGVPMMTRSGDIDPGILFRLLRTGYSVDAAERLLNQQSGIIGVSGARDWRDIIVALGHRVPKYQARTIARQKAQLAFDLYIYRIRKYLGAYAVVLGRVDALIFTGAIGEHSQPTRQAITRSLRLNGSPRVLVIPSQEGLAVAQATKQA